jgi:hypothetical protein
MKVFWNRLMMDLGNNVVAFYTGDIPGSGLNRLIDFQV